MPHVLSLVSWQKRDNIARAVPGRESQRIVRHMTSDRVYGLLIAPTASLLGGNQSALKLRTAPRPATSPR